MFSINAGSSANGENVRYADPLYYGGYGYFYVIGIDGGATFLNNYVAGTLDYVSRIGGMLLINGKMDRIRDVAAFVPAYLANATKDVVAKYEKANGVNAVLQEGSKTTAYNQAFPARQVVTVETEKADAAALIKDAYYNLFIKAVRGQELLQGLNSASTPYQGYSQDSAPYSLSVRNALINGVTSDGIYEFTRVDERFSDMKTTEGEYLQTWYEYLPEEIVKGTAKNGTIPMILALHGGGDDPRQFVDGQGYLKLAGDERLAIIAPEKGSLHAKDANGNSVLAQVLPKLVKYILETYPAIDASRVYVTGYSMGCIASFDAIFGEPTLFAAAFPQAGIAGVGPTEEQAAKFANVDVPLVISTSEYDSSKNVDPANKGIVAEFYNLISTCKKLNGLEALPEADYVKYPRSGFKADVYTEKKLNGEYTMHGWYFLNEKGVPMVGLAYTDDIIHCLYPEYAGMVWDFLKHYSRDLTTGEVVYHPYVH
jgi:predicted peptidase